MKPIEVEEFEIRGAQIAPRRLGLIALAARRLGVLRLMWRPRSDLGSLSARLRRDAGIDDLEIELEKAARAPLIR